MERRPNPAPVELKALSGKPRRRVRKTSISWAVKEYSNEEQALFTWYGNR
jgi:hypothetical protein